jgi:hypothetical protein
MAQHPTTSNGYRETTMCDGVFVCCVFLASVFCAACHFFRDFCDKPSVLVPQPPMKALPEVAVAKTAKKPEINIPEEFAQWVWPALVKMSGPWGIEDEKTFPIKEAVHKVLDEFAKIGAHVDKRGRLCDAAGKEVLIRVETPGGGPPPPPLQESVRRQQDEALQRELDELRKTYTLIELPYMGWPIQ